MENNVFKVVLLLALPASGKSEVRNFMANIEPERLQKEFHIGENLQLDDFPYVHFMRCIDNEMERIGQPRVFYPSDAEPFFNDYDWGTLVQLLNEDYHDLMNRQKIKADSLSRWLFARIDAAALKCGISPRMALISEEVLEKIAPALEHEARLILDQKLSQYPEDFNNKTIVIEAARGGHDGAEMPLTGGFGYQYSLAQFCPEILRDSAILYIWVTPEESRRKNFARANPDDPGSNLFHGVPLPVMMGDYGCDDMEYLRKTSEVADTVTVKTYGSTYHLPIGVFDNRIDKTSFLREDKEKWDAEMVADVTEGIRSATDAMYKNYGK